MPEHLLTTTEIANLLHVTSQRVRQLAANRHIAPVRTAGTAKLWRAEDLPRFQRRPPGRPRS
jgi:excisionase family DNA binding protein